MPKQDKGKQNANLKTPVIKSTMRVSRDGKWLIIPIELVVIKPISYLEKVLKGS